MSCSNHLPLYSVFSDIWRETAGSDVMDHADLCGSLHLRGGQRLPLHIIAVSLLPSFCPTFPLAEASRVLCFLGFHRPDFASFSQALLCRSEGRPSSTFAGNDPRHTLHSHPSPVVHCEFKHKTQHSLIIFCVQSVLFRDPCTFFLLSHLVDLHSADVMHQRHLHPHKLCGFHQQFLLWCHCCWADCTALQTAWHASAH